MSWVGVCGGFLVEGDADSDEGFEGVVEADEGDGAVVGVEVEEVEEGFWEGLGLVGAGWEGGL